jgi:hypothetical protein
MPGRPKPKPLDAFADNMADARHVINLAEALTNTRVRRMRRELRERVGEALKVKVIDRDKLDCLKSDDLFVTFLRNGRLQRSDFSDSRPLLRQALVAACAAAKTYLADKVMERVGLCTSFESASPRLKKVPMTVGNWLHIEDEYRRRRWGLRAVIEDHVRERASTAPSSLGEVLRLIGVENWSKKPDQERRRPKGPPRSCWQGSRTGATASPIPATVRAGGAQT